MDWKAAVGKIAPVLGMALTGNIPGAAAAAVGTIAEALGLDTKTPEAVAIAMKGMTPEQALLLKKADQDFAMAQIKELNRTVEELERIAAQDRDSARKREIAVKDYTPMILAYIVSIGFFGVLSFMLTKSIPDTGKEALLIMLGSLGAAWTGVIAYYFGSSAGSLKKTDIIARSQPPSTL